MTNPYICLKLLNSGKHISEWSVHSNIHYLLMKYSRHFSMVHFMSVLLNTWIMQETFYPSQEEET